MLSGAENDEQVTDRSTSGIHPRQKKSLSATWQSTKKSGIKKYLKHAGATRSALQPNSFA